MKRRLLVTQDIIDHGVPGLPDRCPVALAAQEQWHHEATVHVYMGYVQITLWPADKNVPRLDILLPDSVYWRVANFDREEVMEPFDIELDLPSVDWLEPKRTDQV